MSRPVIVEPPDPGWGSRYREEVRRLRRGLTLDIEAIHHIGSTSVPGLAAKPIIDVLMEVGDVTRLDRREAEMVALGYEAMGEYGLPGRRFFRRSVDGRRSHHVHAYACGHPELARHLAFRDYLRAHPEEARRYGALKLRLAQQFPRDMQAYITGKAEFVEIMERNALTWVASTGRGPARIQAVLFDADGVVQVPSPDWRRSLAALCGDPARVEAFLAEVFAAERPCLTGADDFEAALAGVLGRWSCARSVEEAMRVWTLIDPCEPVLDVVRRLREAGTCTGLATNQQAFRSRHMTEVLGYGRHFDHLFISCDLGWAKPSSEFFGVVLDRLGMAPRQVLFLDDHPTNVDAARESGLNATVYHLDQGVEALERLLLEQSLAL